MSKTQIYTLVIAVTICLLATAGFMGISDIVQAASQTVDRSQAVSFNDTPVQYAHVNGVTLGYREFGSGEPLLMVTGFGGTMNGWNQTFIGILATKYHVYTYDHRGMGYSSDNNATPSIAQYADDAAGLMTALGYGSMHVYGVSMGSSISQQLVIDHPERVRKLVLDSASDSIRIPETKRLLGIIEAVNVDPTYSQGIHEEAQADLAWNGTDTTPDVVSVRMAGQINGSWLVRFKGLPHAGSQYAPVEYGENALTFLGMDESPLSK
jgi:pimeloyl-ACP methyl ester carboxylesterase